MLKTKLQCQKENEQIKNQLIDILEHFFILCEFKSEGKDCDQCRENIPNEILWTDNSDEGNYYCTSCAISSINFSKEMVKIESEIVKCVDCGKELNKIDAIGTLKNIFDKWIWRCRPCEISSWKKGDKNDV